MRLDFDLGGGGGFVVARKAFRLDIPESYSFGFNVRGIAPRNAFEFKLVDETNQNVWRYRVESFDFPEEWQPLWMRSSQIGFAWGPLGGGSPSRVAAIELVIAAGVAEEWLSDGFTVGVENLASYYGRLTYSLRLEEKDTLHLKLGGDLVVPPGGSLLNRLWLGPSGRLR
jgi:hypothetical protein